MRFLKTFFIVATLAGCGAPPSTPVPHTIAPPLPPATTGAIGPTLANPLANVDPLVVPVPLSAAEVNLAQAAVRRGLKDPDSARFDDIKGWASKKGDIGVCGWVNAKNSFGGYAGRSPFLADLKRSPKPVITGVWVASNENERQVAEIICPGILTAAIPPRQ